jgi:Holliday junction DNA helicase RuvA
MIAYLKGEITFKSPGSIVVEVAGIGYLVNISLNTYAKAESLERIKILTYQHIKEDSHTLYGFAEAEERSLFVHLISVSGIGPATAQQMLSSLKPEEIRNAIIGENVAAFKQVKGVGPKTAKRLILDLKDKLLKESGGEALTVGIVDNTMREEALSALVALGFNKSQVQKTLNRIIRSEASFNNVEELVKLTLKELS